MGGGRPGQGANLIPSLAQIQGQDLAQQEKPPKGTSITLL
jgi:hypothetical protein